MAKLLKILGKIFLSLLEWTLIFIFVLAFAIRSVSFQTFIASEATSYLSDELGSEFRIERVDISLLNKVYLKGVYIEDQKKDTLASIASLELNMASLNFKNLVFGLDKLSLKDARINLKTYKGDSDLNLQFIVDYFATEEDTTATPNFAIRFNTVELSNVDFSFIDENEALSDFGMDYDHMRFKHTNINFSNVVYTPSGIVASLDKLSTYEEFSKFKLNELKGELNHSEMGIFFKNFKLITDKTELNAELLNLTTYSYANYTEFVDSVDFNVEISNSKISMEDIAVFAPDLKGMSDTVFLDVKATQKIKNLNLSELYFKFGQSSYIAGNFILPDFREEKALRYNESLNDFYITLSDVERMTLPESSGITNISLPSEVKSLNYINGNNVRLTGNSKNFKIKAKNIRTDLGEVNIHRDLMFNYDNQQEAYLFGEYKDSASFLDVKAFDLGRFLGQKDFGVVNGSFAISGNASSFSDIKFTSISGDVDRFEYMKYAYKKIKIKESTIIGSKIYSDLTINDDNLGLSYKGSLDFSDNESANFDLRVNWAHLEKLNLGVSDTTDFEFSIHANLRDFLKDEFMGQVDIEDICYNHNGENLELNEINLVAVRTSASDNISLNSDYIDANIRGKFDFASIPSNIVGQIEKTFPALFLSDVEEKIVEKEISGDNNFIYQIEFKNAEPILNAVYPDLFIAKNSLLKGKFNSGKEDYKLFLESGRIEYQDYYVGNVSIDQDLTKGQIITVANADVVHLSDTLQCNDLHFTTFGFNDYLDSQISWNDTSDYATSLSWGTNIISDESFDFTLMTSTFSVQDHKWTLRKNAKISVKPDTIVVDDFSIKREDQYIKLNGLLTNSVEDKMHLDIKNFDINDFAILVQNDIDAQGKMNIEGSFATPFTDLFFDGEGKIDSLIINQEAIGNVDLKTKYNSKEKKLDLAGEIDFKEFKTFEFNGFYDLLKEKDNIDFKMNFDKANLAIANAFMDPDVVSDIGGKLIGDLRITGEFDAPKIDGNIKLQNGKAKLALLGALFKFDGDLAINKEGINIEDLPIIDEEGNVGSINGFVKHENFKDINYELNFNFDEPSIRGRRRKLDKFLVMNTAYSPDDYYYGKAYVTGNAKISGDDENINIDVNVKTEKGSWIDFPMYGASEVEEVKFIEWLPKELDTLNNGEPKIDFTGVDMNLDIEVTPETRLKVIFNENIDDEIITYGSGDINIGLDNLNQLSMEGVFTVDRGNYNFAMSAYKQNFTLVKGGTVQWTGSPYNAVIDIETFYKTNANIDVLVSEAGGSGSKNDEVYCYLDLKGELLKPNITFDIRAPKASELGKSTLARIRSDEDELNKQFFSLLILKQFRPLNGEGTAVGGALTMDLISTQINSVLNKFNTGANIGVMLDKDDRTGDNSLEVGLTKEFLDDKLIVSTSFGVENHSSASSANTSNIVGDVKLEYILNEPRTLRVNVYNESNDYSVIQTNNGGQYTQGVGLHYQEDFQKLNDFKLFQYIGNLFRKEKKVSKNNNKKPIPQKYIDNPGLLEEEE